jgi:hypothetical protein
VRRSRFGLLSLLLVLAALLVTLQLAEQASASAGAYKVLIVYADADIAPTTFANQIKAQAGIGSVDVVNGESGTPDAASLAQYDMVIVFSDSNFSDAATLGNELADYTDQGGVVMEYAYATQNNSNRQLQGRWASGGYDPVVGGPNDNASRTLGSFDAASPLMQGVNTLTDKEDTTNTLAAGAVQVAATNDGHPLVVYKGRAVAVTFYPGDNGTGIWSGDFGRLAANAVNWLGRHNLTVTKAGTGAGTVASSPAGIDCGTSCTAAYAYGTPVTLTATAAPGSTFAGWSGGGCSGTGPCTVALDSAMNLTATFNAVPRQAPEFGGLKLKGKTVTVKHGKVTLALSCPATSIGKCVGTDTLTTASKVVAAKKKAKILTLGKHRFSIPAGKSAKVTIKLNKTALKLLAKKHTLKIRQTVVARDSRNLSKKTTGSMTLKAAKKKHQRKR